MAHVLLLTKILLTHRLKTGHYKRESCSGPVTHDVWLYSYFVE